MKSAIGSVIQSAILIVQNVRLELQRNFGKYGEFLPVLKNNLFCPSAVFRSSIELPDTAVLSPDKPQKNESKVKVIDATKFKSLNGKNRKGTDSK